MCWSEFAGQAHQRLDPRVYSWRVEPTQNEFLEAVVCAVTSIGPDNAFILGYNMMLLLTLKGMFRWNPYDNVNRYDGVRREPKT
jgi:hypothetical protein